MPRYPRRSWNGSRDEVPADTHTFLWWILDSPRLSEEARRIVGDGSNEPILSAANSWEMALEHRLGRLEIPSEDLGEFLADQIRRQGFTTLPVEHAHAWRVAELPLLHRDPFDRILIAQAQTEGLPILTVDAEIARYHVETLW